jgi:tetratricopeptide (TPR) repeat protein
MSCKFLRVRLVDGQYRALIRFVGEDMGLTYREFVVARYPDGSIASDDIFQFETAELLSQTLRRILDAVAPAQGKDGKPRSNRESMIQIAALTSMTAAARRGDSATVIEKFNQLPASLQENKSVLFFYIKGLSMAENQKAAYLKALDQFRNLFPNDPCLDMLLLAYHFEKREFALALEPISRLDQSIGGDPYLHVMRAECHIGLKQYENARTEATAAIKEEPDLEDAYWIGIRASLLEMNHAETLEGLKRLVESCRVDIPDLSQEPDYAGFVKSSQHSQWLTWYAERKK